MLVGAEGLGRLALVRAWARRACKVRGADAARTLPLPFALAEPEAADEAGRWDDAHPRNRAAAPGCVLERAPRAPGERFGSDLSDFWLVVMAVISLYLLDGHENAHARHNSYNLVSVVVEPLHPLCVKGGGERGSS